MVSMSDEFPTKANVKPSLYHRFVQLSKQYLLASFYIALVVGSYLILITTGYPKARASPSFADYHLRNGHIIFVVAVASWFYTLQKSPGVITAETRSLYDHYEYDGLLYPKGTDRLPRSKYDRFKYKAFIPRFDHYCGWVGNTIGEENYRTFLGFVFTQFFLCLYASYVILLFFQAELLEFGLNDSAMIIDIATGKEFEVTYWILANFLWSRNPWEMTILAITGSLTILLAYFLLYHFRITSFNKTTNEDYKWQKVRDWHEAKVVEHEIYKRQAQNAPKAVKTKPLVIPESDVGCTGANNSEDSLVTDKVSDTDVEGEEGEEVEDPGPMPTNRYDRGFVENWKEVLWPLSVRKKAARQKAKAT